MLSRYFFVEKVRLRWFEHAQRRDGEYVGRRMMRLELPDRRPRGRPKRRFLDVVKEDMKLVGVKDRVRWRQMFGNSQKEKEKMTPLSHYCSSNPILIFFFCFGLVCFSS